MAFKKITIWFSLLSIMNLCTIEAQDLKQQFDSIKTDLAKIKKFTEDVLKEVQSKESIEKLNLIKEYYIESAKNGNTDFIIGFYNTISPVLDDNDKHKLLFNAVGYGQIEITAFFIKNGFDVNYYGIYEYPLITLAVENSDTSMMELLLKNKANSEALYLGNWTPFGNAIYKLHEMSTTADVEKCIGVLKMLIKYGANANAMLKDGTIPLHRAVSTCYVPLIELLLKNGADKFVNYKSENTNSSSYDCPLYFAIINNKKDPDNIKTINLLLEYGADMNMPLKNGDPFIHLIINQNSEELLRFIIDKGADIHMVDEGGRNLIWIATCNEKENSVRVLIEKGVDKNKKGKHYWEEKELTPLELAKSKKYENIVKLLKD